MDELLTKARKELEPPWDDVREARVLARVLDDAQRAPRGTRQRWLLVAAAVLVAASAAAVFVLAPRRNAPSPSASATTPKAVVPAPTPREARGDEAPSVLALADGSRAHLRPGSEVQSLEQTPRGVRLLQPRGVVRYEVKPDATRPFSVTAGGVEVRVIGTVFTVSVEADAVRVAVETGHVVVHSGSRTVELSRGENVRLTTLDSSALPRAPSVSALPAAPRRAAEPPAPFKEEPSVLIQEADRARAQGNLASAEQLYAKLLRNHGGSAQATSAAFALGRVQRGRGNFVGAARTFDELRRRAPASPLAEDALAEAAGAWAMAGDKPQAQRLATEYRERYPNGHHTERMRRLGAP